MAIAASPVRAEAPTARGAGVALMLAGAGGLAVATWGLWRDVGWIAQPFYAYAWWSYILLVDGFTAFRRGSSLLTDRRRHLLPICVWSVTFWFFFELLNLRFQNWYYVGVFEVVSPLDAVVRGIYSVACFATVFTGLFETYDALTSLGLFRDRGARARRFAPWVSYAIQGFGLLMIALSLLSSEYLAPLVWGSLTFVIDPWNYRHGARSLLGDLERGRSGRLLRLLLAGLLCGLVWESLNFFAPQKWVYTVRGLEGLKLFEMPLLGFLGFPALALDAFAAYSLVSYRFHGNATWEHPDDVERRPAARRALSPTRLALLVPLHVLFWGSVSFFMQDVNVGSLQLELRHVDALRPGDLAALRGLGIERPRQLLRVTRDPARERELQAALGLTRDEFERLLEQVRLYTFKGIGHHHGALLRGAGIERVADLRDADPDRLFLDMLRHREERSERTRHVVHVPALRSGMVRVWVLAARSESGASP